jgi:hypothetical protein
MNDSMNVPSSRSGGRFLMLAGLVVPVLGVTAYAIQFSFQRLMLPWYMPAAALLGVALVVASLSRRPSLLRVLALVVVMFLAGVRVHGPECHALGAVHWAYRHRSTLLGGALFLFLVWHYVITHPVRSHGEDYGAMAAGLLNAGLVLLSPIAGFLTGFPVAPAICACFQSRGTGSKLSEKKSNLE